MRPGNRGELLDAAELALEAVGDGVQQGPQVRNMMAFLPSLANFPELAPGEKKALELKITGNPLWADRCEEIAFNSFPASMTPDQNRRRRETAAPSPA